MSIYGNPITTSFLNRLPDAYQEVTYIENTNEEYIDLPIYTSDIARGNVKWLTVSNHTWSSHMMAWLFGGSSSDSSGQSPATVGVCISPHDSYGGFGYATNLASISCASENVLYDLQFEVSPGSQRYVLNDVITTTSYTETIASSTQISLFGLKFGDGVHPAATAYARVYSFKLYDFSNNTLLDLVPCYRISDSKAGMFDRVRQTFFSDSGSGNFSVGNNVK